MNRTLCPSYPLQCHVPILHNAKLEGIRVIATLFSHVFQSYRRVG